MGKQATHLNKLASNQMNYYQDDYDDRYYRWLDQLEDQEHQEDDEDNFYAHPSLTPAQRNS